MVAPTHYIFDGICSKNLDSIIVAEEFVREVVETLGLHIVVRSDGSEVIDSLLFKEDEELGPDQFGPGVSCLALISESNIALHTRTWEGKVNLDIFSCRPFESSNLFEIVHRYFNVTRTDRSLLLRR